MNDKTIGSVHWSFWVIGVAALVWNVLGAMNFIMQMNPDSIAGYPESHRAIIVGRPAWATAGFAIAVFGGALGSVLLLLRKSSALYLLVASLLGVALTMVHTIGIAASNPLFGPVDGIMTILMPLLVAAILAGYARQAGHKGWIR